MKLLKCKVLLPILCSLAILLSIFGSVMVSGSQNMPWRDGQELTELDKILERDGYLEGIMFPWFTHQFLGNGLTGNDLLAESSGGNSWNKVGLHELGLIKLYREIYNLKVMGYNIMGYEGSPYGEGVIYDANGDVIGIKQEYLDNLRIFLDICREVGMPVAWTVTFHSTTLNDYHEWGKNAWDVISQAYANPVVADHYAENFVKPLCNVLNEYPDVVVLMVSTVEVENEINDSAIGNHFDQRYLYGTNQDNMLYFIKAVTDAVKEKMPNVARSLASNAKDMTIYEGIDFDMFGVNHYTISAKGPNIADLKGTKPMLVTEFGFGDKHATYDPVNNPEGSVEDEVWTIKQINFRNDFIEKGYKGWFHWCWSSTGYGGGYDLLAPGGLSSTDFRAGAFAIKYNADNYRAEHRGEEIIIDKPVLFCNTGSGRVEWVSSRQAYALTIERSYDGGKTWQVIAENLDPLEYEKDFKGTYIDEEVANCTTGGTVCYRITADDGWGDIAVSEPNNVAEIVGPPVNVFGDYNCSFEDGMNGWQEFGINAATSEDGTGKYYAAVVKKDFATDGEYVLEVKDTEPVEDWNGIHMDGIIVKPNTNYVISYDYMMADPETEYMTSYFFIRGFVGDGSGSAPGSGTYCDDHLAANWLNNGAHEKWTTETISFKTNSSDKLGLDLRVMPGNHYYIDNIEMYEVR